MIFRLNIYTMQEKTFSQIEYVGCIDLVEPELWKASWSILEDSTSRKDIRKD